MAKVSFEDVVNQSSNQNTSSVGFFNLKNDGDTAIVRIMHDSVDSFEVMTVHKEQGADKRFRSINCERGAKDPIEKCPLCASGSKVSTRIFIHMIQYVTTDDGRVEPRPVIWERSAREYGTKLASYISEMGPLSDYLFKIKRVGQPGDMKTNYEFFPCNPSVYNETTYPKMNNAFDDFTVLGGIVAEQNADSKTSVTPNTTVGGSEENFVPTRTTTPPWEVGNTAASRPVRARTY